MINKIRVIPKKDDNRLLEGGPVHCRRFMVYISC